MPTNANSQDLVVVKEVRDNTVMLAGGGLCQIVMVGGVNFPLKSEMEQNAITLAYQDFLNGLDFPVQIVVHSRKINIQKYLDHLEERQEKESSALLQSQISEYREFIKSFVEKNAIMRKIFLLVVPYYAASLPSKETLSGFLPFLKKKKPAEEKVNPEEEAEFKKNLAQLEQRTAQVIEGLRTIGLETSVLNDEQLLELFYNFYNPETVEKEHITMQPS